MDGNVLANLGDMEICSRGSIWAKCPRLMKNRSATCTQKTD